MTKVAAFHSTHPSATVYHDNSKCTEGNNIEKKYLKPGTANRPKCEHCKRLS
jgi:hypothetical protein